MKIGLIRIIATVAIGSLITVAGAGSAGAGTTVPRAHGTAEATAPAQAAAADLQRIHDQLATAADAKDVAAIASSVEELRPVLDRVDAMRLERTTDAQLDTANQRTAELRDALASINSGQRQADPVVVVVGLVPALLVAVLVLVGGLLGPIVVVPVTAP